MKEMDIEPAPSDYATYNNALQNITSTAARNDYHMVTNPVTNEWEELRLLITIVQIDTDYYLPVLMDKYFIQNPVGQSRTSAFLKYVNDTSCGYSAR